MPPRCWPRRSPAACSAPAPGSSSNPWHGDADLHLLLDNRKTIIDGETVPAGTRLTWAGPNGNADITFRADRDFAGTVEYPGTPIELRYRGTAR